eukprot:gene1234-50084_t
MGHVKAPPMGHTDDWLRQRGRGLKQILANAKRKREEKAGEEKIDANEKDPKKLRAAMKRRVAKLVVKHRFKVDETQWPTMPTVFPRCPETDEAGGALELTRLNTKLPEIRSIANRVKNVREFIDVHTPTTFCVTREEGRIIVRLSDDPPPKPGEAPSWLAAGCPDCGKVVPGHNLPRHRTSKGCVALQMLLGREGKGKSSIALCAGMSFRILETGGCNSSKEWMYALADRAPNPWHEYNECLRLWLSGAWFWRERTGRALEAAEEGDMRAELTALHRRTAHGGGRKVRKDKEVKSAVLKESIGRDFASADPEAGNAPLH